MPNAASKTDARSAAARDGASRSAARGGAGAPGGQGPGGAPSPGGFGAKDAYRGGQYADRATTTAGLAGYQGKVDPRTGALSGRKLGDVFSDVGEDNRTTGYANQGYTQAQIEAIQRAQMDAMETDIWGELAKLFGGFETVNWSSAPTTGEASWGVDIAEALGHLGGLVTGAPLIGNVIGYASRKLGRPLRLGGETNNGPTLGVGDANSNASASIIGDPRAEARAGGLTAQRLGDMFV